MSETKIPDHLVYSESHEWILQDSDIATIGITDFAQTELGDIVFVELPEIGEHLEMGEAFGTVEAVKTVADLLAPISGEVLEINETLEESASKSIKTPTRPVGCSRFTSTIPTTSNICSAPVNMPNYSTITRLIRLDILDFII